MKEIEYIVGIYHYLNVAKEENAEAAYFLLYLLDDKGLLEIDIAHKLYQEKFKDKFQNEFNREFNNDTKSPSRAIGPFESVDHLNQFAFLLCEEMNAAKVSLLSVAEYNTLLENTHQSADFFRDLIDKGNVMENIERKKKGMISRFFS